MRESVESPLPQRDPADRPDIIALPPVLWFLSILASSLIHFFLKRTPVGQSVVIVPMGIALVIGALSLAFWAVRAMRGVGTNVRPDRPALAIAKAGPYRYTRNPMYLGLCLLQVAWGLILNDWIPVLFVVPLALLLHYGVVLREEAYLEKKFGETYSKWKNGIRRWL
jgi:protein-S-isoprenylcysteine O-methyltransferase Ste14